MPARREVIRQFAVIVAASIGVLWLALLNWRTYRPGHVETAIAQLRFLKGALEDGAGERMQELFPEGYVFTWALYGLASAQTLAVLPESDERQVDMLRAASTAVAHVQSDVAKRTFVRAMVPEFGAFYVSWSLYLRSVILRSTGADAAPFDLAEFERDCAAFAAVLESSDDPLLPSYPDAAWPADTGVGVAALAIRDGVLGPRYTAVINEWVAGVRERVDPTLGAVPQAAGFLDASPSHGPRGESLALLSLILVDVDRSLARQQYEILRANFVDYVWGVPGVREYPHGVKGKGDVDSGPLPLGFSGPAIVVAAGAAIAHGDEHVANALLATAEVFGLPIEIKGRRRYALGLLPVGDAFLAWARTVTPARPSTDAARYDRIIPRMWRVPLQAVSLLIAGVIIRVALRSARAARTSLARRVS
jgi:hypothetical protein